MKDVWTQAGIDIHIAILKTNIIIQQSLVLASFIPWYIVCVFAEIEKLETQLHPGATAALYYKTWATSELKDALFMKEKSLMF